MVRGAGKGETQRSRYPCLLSCGDSGLLFFSVPLERKATSTSANFSISLASAASPFNREHIFDLSVYPVDSVSAVRTKWSSQGRQAGETQQFGKHGQIDNRQTLKL